MSGYSAPGYFENKIALGATGVRADWREQDGPALVVPIFYEDTGYLYS